MPQPFALIAGLMLTGSLIFSIVTLISLMRKHDDITNNPGDVHNQQLDFLQSLVMIYGALLPVYLPELYNDLRTHQETRPAGEEAEHAGRKPGRPAA